MKKIILAVSLLLSLMSWSFTPCGQQTFNKQLSFTLMISEANNFFYYEGPLAVDGANFHIAVPTEVSHLVKRFNSKAGEKIIFLKVQNESKLDDFAKDMVKLLSEQKNVKRKNVTPTEAGLIQALEAN